MSHLRELSGIPDPYHAFNREERHLAAVLFHLLQDRARLDTLLRRVAGLNWPLADAEFGIYFEYAHLRDLWHKMGHYSPHGADGRRLANKAIRTRLDEANDHKRTAVVKLFQALKVSDATVAKLSDAGTVGEFNSLFNGRSAKKEILPPSLWRIDVMAKSFPRGDLEIAAQIKWAFNAKPDLVIHTDRDHALCLELKLESGEGSYGGDALERAALAAAGGGQRFVGRQTEIQRFLMRDLLGLEARFLFITRKGEESAGEPDCRTISWQRLFEELAPPADLAPYLQSAIRFACGG